MRPWIWFREEFAPVCHDQKSNATLPWGVCPVRIGWANEIRHNASGQERPRVQGNLQETDFEPGDSLVEAEGMVHFGENRGTEPVVLLVASLLESDQPPGTIIEIDPAATPAS